MPVILEYLLHLSIPARWAVFLAENVLITFLVLLIGNAVLKRSGVVKSTITSRDWWYCVLTNVLNTVVTYAGYWLWEKGMIRITMEESWQIVTHFLLLFFAMDLLMFVFHYLIHKTFLFKAVHHLHHESVDPSPIDLFVLHPVETIAFGSLWICLLILFPFNIYAIAIYLTVNVIFGLAGHLGLEPLPEELRNKPVVKFLGTSTFHHNHHRNVEYNFGFYTSIWDRMLGTYKRY
ncbi:Fatty acid hydroxylase superfamily protein [Chitinophaga rupis]|uniref:Fatty acid hydroxylase superfamily protein n=1 Tax=Chitinophaga rupis TaxID=573321 RepID=A0A1H7ZSG0_9BACT|nr:sterol desaturase family protein [Chitinophaga rupis]SEM61206.1 Fatty acid hydroxylase superfamily protein [Chitinophaga rupis]